MEGEKNTHTHKRREATHSSDRPLPLSKTYEYSQLVIEGRAVHGRIQIVAVNEKLSSGELHFSSCGDNKPHVKEHD